MKDNFEEEEIYLVLSKTSMATIFGLHDSMIWELERLNPKTLLTRCDMFGNTHPRYFWKI